MILSLGAGVQSTALYIMAATRQLPAPFDVMPGAAIFADTGWEPKKVYAHLDRLDSEFGRVFPIRRVSAGHIREDALAASRRSASMPLHVLNEQGQPTIIRRQCTKEYKLEPINKEVRRILGVDKGRRVPKHVRVERMIGISLDEAERMKTSYDKWAVNVYPLVEMGWTRHDCALWLARNGYGVPPKSSCLGCPFHSRAQWREIKQDPEEWADVVAFDRAIRDGGVRMGKAALRGLAYLHQSLRPLDEVDFDTAEDKGQLGFDWYRTNDYYASEEHRLGFANECEGLCGV